MRGEGGWSESFLRLMLAFRLLEALKRLAFGVFLRVLVAIGSGRSKLVHRGSIFHTFPLLRVFNAEKYCFRWITKRISRGLLVECMNLNIMILESRRKVVCYVRCMTFLTHGDFTHEWVFCLFWLVQEVELKVHET